MLEETTFKKDEIKDEIYEIYGISIEKIEKINQGTANIYKLFSNNNKYILKEFQSKYSEEDVLREIKAIGYLKENTKIPLPEFVICKNGNKYFKHNGKTVIMQKFIEGHVYNKNEGNYKNIIESAYYLGNIINGFDGFETSESMKIKELYSIEEFNKAEIKYNEILKKIGNSEIEKITHKVSHGDYSCLQFIYDDKNEVKAIIDFIKVKKLPIVWEIARSYSYIDQKAKNGDIDIDNIVSYTNAVAKITNLNKYDRKYLPYVYLIQLARSAYGYEQYFEDVKNKNELLDFAFYRTNICRSLYKKAKEISNKLLNGVKEL